MVDDDEEEEGEDGEVISVTTELEAMASTGGQRSALKVLLNLCTFNIINNNNVNNAGAWLRRG